MKRTLLTLAPIVGLALLAACSSPATATETSTSVSPPATSSSVEVVAPQGPAPIGSAQTMTAGEFSITVTAFSIKTVPAAKYSSLPPNTQNTALDVQVCTSDPIKVGSEDRWALVDASNGRYEPESFPDQKEAPEYPYYTAELAADECVRGWIMFETRVDQSIVTARYQTSNGNLLKWDIPKS